MSIFSKIVTAIRGGAREAGEAVVDSQATRIFEQEIKDAEHHLKKAREELTGVMAEQMKLERQKSTLKADINEHEGFVEKALQQGDESLAMEVAEKIAVMENEVSEKDVILENCVAQIARLKKLISQGEKQMAEHRRQLSMVKTTESVQKATSAISDSFINSSSKLNNAKESLDRIKNRQQRYDDKLKAAEELQSEMNGDDLKDRLRKSGITGEAKPNANAVLERLKKKQGQ
ncbi:PspA/IM30 family protein [Pelagibaculum spongiae]|uniref:Phage shock protein A n=1 Tax=Pelagibaculum spongiae TaxID=2080658 RepID=A0A2V1GYF0_9GAMM|nr:PspA/IM30 family protein [Pelagibaculum spongiae]PVZ67694.1 phage shock protein A [Pelagibaculum spongiae]